MGVLSSKWRRQERGADWQWKGPPGHHSGYPVDRISYPGPEREYCFLDFMVSYQIMTNSVNLGPRPVTTSVQQCLGELMDCYQNGYHMNHFVKVPDLTTITQEPDWACPHTYQAILSKSAASPAEPQAVELNIKKKIVSSKMLPSDEGTAAEQLLLAIEEQAALGGRLVCAQSIGYVRPTSADCHCGVIGVELFCEMPVPPPSTPTCEFNVLRRYRYHAAEVHNKYYTSPDGFHHVHRIMCDTDFRGQLKVFLDQGWKLVDICYDTIRLPEVFKMKSRSMTINTMWIFEKEAHKLGDTTPRYEGVVLEYRHQVEVCHGVQMPCRDWRAVIAGMGANGWELATIVETPSVAQSALRSYSIKLLFIFQRKIIASYERQRRLHDAQFPSFQQRREMFEQIFRTRTTEALWRYEDGNQDKLANGGVRTDRQVPLSTGPESLTTCRSCEPRQDDTV
ncbi:hypothetical protein LSAT2_003013 [Lamellibrachia satsuma]|nr:hypothetical protein LSAT2_003013 [Lamellibrachia satsuma]